DGLLFVTPEYNFSIPGGLKNVIDWLSRGEDQPLSGKPVAILSATGGPLGGARVQYDLRRVMLFVNAMALIKPEVFVGNVAAKFSADGQCIDEATRKIVGVQMAAFEQWIGAVKRMAAPAQ
ncbi:MAG TPA: NAD(P)H-dependent oxidoreductase, partial [Burkholderiaceae bacterium]